MSYISAIRKGNSVIVWERDKNGRKIKQYDAPFYFYIEDENGEYTDLYGKKLSKLEYSEYSEFRDSKSEYSLMGKELYESDISPQLKILSKHYYDVDAPKLNVCFYDIEVDYSNYNPKNSDIIKINNIDPNKESGEISLGDLKNEKKEVLIQYTTYSKWLEKEVPILESEYFNNGFPRPGGNAYAVINAVALYNNWQHKIICIAIPPHNEDPENYDIQDIIEKMNDIEAIEIPIELILVSSEEELLKLYIDHIQDSDLILGWNSEGFDNPYVAERIEKVLGKKYFNLLSFPGARPPRYREYERFGTKQTTVDLSGRIAADYLEIYKKYKVVNQPSYKLESIAETELPQMRKLEFEGSLYDLYRNDFIKFLRYNIRDTEILYAFEEKLGYVGIANELYHSSTGLFEHITGTLKTTELAFINFCHYDLDVIVSDNKDGGTSETFEGAYVLDPKVGMHKWISSVDINSLYPSSIRSINISPETIIGQFVNEKEAFEAIKNNENIDLEFEFELSTAPEKIKSGEISSSLTLSAKAWKEQIPKNGWCISGFGTVFTQKKKGMVPSVLESWYSSRKVFQGKKKECLEEAQNILDKYK